MRTLSLVIVVLVLAGCGLDAQTLRACDVYSENGCGSDERVSEWVKHFSTPEGVARIEAENERQRAQDLKWGTSSAKIETIESRAESQAAYAVLSNAKALAITARRLGLSEREVLAAVKKCEQAKKK